MLYTTFNLY